ncbi:hypothetical protein [Nocardia abscessus]|uniref:DUF3784 domain-containing protein n=1 Tax=Nocardia abscessus TaxID=120957 RepID=A0ABS0CAM5_9NOCA|nr:hypothetical protein [Nocardia abscessus]MBF6225704.1 hypothetical protein [Nocardia abscessus]
MRPLIVALIFGLIFIACVYIASKGYRGVATSRSEGYGENIPDHVLADPDRRRKLNRMVFFWGALAAALCVPPIVYLAYILSDPNRVLHTRVLIILAIYGLTVTIAAGYPLEKMKNPE